MTSPSKVGEKWPEAVRVGAIVMDLGKRAINIDPEDVDDCDDATLLEAKTIIGTMGASTVEWEQGPVATKQPRKPVSGEEAEAAVRAGAAVFVCRGSNYRHYTPPADMPADESAPAAEKKSSPVDNNGATTAAPATNGDAAAANGGNGGEEAEAGTRTKKQYTKAVAFEFVNDVLGNVLGEEDVTKAWAA